MIFTANTPLSGLVQKEKLGLRTLLKYINYYAFNIQKKKGKNPPAKL